MGKCVHKGCGKVFADPEEDCVYHPGPPVFHEGQKGWKCCKPRVLTFEEFLSIPPCTTGKHSEVDDTPVPEPKKAAEEPPAAATPVPRVKPISERPPITPAIATPGTPPQSPLLRSQSRTTQTWKFLPMLRAVGKDAGLLTMAPLPVRKKCVHHPGNPVFHEGSKGWSCCKRRVLEFDEFLRIPGCTEKKRHMFVGKAKPPGEEKVETVRNDFYQTPASVNVSLYLKKIDKERAVVKFTADKIELDLPTMDNKRYQDTYELFAPIDAEQSSFRVLGTKLELTLVKADQTGWPVLRKDDKWTGQRIQVGNAGRA
ncbi:hypothetical protein N7509_012244 [Penicillium cosmopolitanum]|uniref:CS domain-containing protein n=1 Tax=Penicillium cosmopolitanum TaxID=1131564 RepID=A0A9W9SJJ9_9EURO|nr:uncharacterized protein N7509_012244 [Penicillium cosmopolitanum]KAJ5379125.1 hypothetical protein N7509_012244 [Penicillium cosmopolitanum]